MYIKIIRRRISPEPMIVSEMLYECSGVYWNLDQVPAGLFLENTPGHGFDVLLGGQEGEEINIFTMNSQGKTIDSRSMVF